MTWEILQEDYESFKKRFEKVPENVDVFGPVQLVKYAVVFITIAGITYLVIKIYRSQRAKL